MIYKKKLLTLSILIVTVSVLSRFGYSASFDEVFKTSGITVSNVVVSNPTNYVRELTTDLYSSDFYDKSTLFDTKNHEIYYAASGIGYSLQDIGLNYYSGDLQMGYHYCSYDQQTYFSGYYVRNATPQRVIAYAAGPGTSGNVLFVSKFTNSSTSSQNTIISIRTYSEGLSSYTTPNVYTTNYRCTKCLTPIHSVRPYSNPDTVTREYQGWHVGDFVAEIRIPETSAITYTNCSFPQGYANIFGNLTGNVNGRRELSAEETTHPHNFQNCTFAKDVLIKAGAAITFTDCTFSSDVHISNVECRFIRCTFAKAPDFSNTSGQETAHKHIYQDCTFNSGNLISNPEVFKGVCILKGNGHISLNNTREGCTLDLSQWSGSSISGNGPS